MCAFEINLYAAKQEFYRYSTEDFALLEIGIGNYNISSLARFFNTSDDIGLEQKQPENPDIKEFFSDQPSKVTIEKLIGKGKEASMEIMAYDENEKKYKLKKGLAEIKKLDTTRYKAEKYTEPSETNIVDFLNKWNDVQMGFEPDEKIANGYTVVAHRIQNSMSGCITFNAEFQVLKEQEQRKSLIKLFILNNKDNDSSRTISFNGSPFISAIPQTAEGMRYGFTNTQNTAVGVYEKTSGDENNPKDKVAGQLRAVWDPVTKTWESGTQQVMARLIDNIDAANIPQLTGNQLLNLSQEDVYETDPETNPIMGKPPKGRAVVLSTENGNPNLFGPNFRGGCSNPIKKSIIKVVNRSQRSYKEGTLVVCSLINGEWIIVSGEGDRVESKKTLAIGRFEFQQYMIPANLYFAVPDSNQKLLPDVLISKIRDDYYTRLYDGSRVSYVNTNDTNTSDIKIINLIAKSIPTDMDPALYITNSYGNTTITSTILSNADSNRKVYRTMDTLDFINKYYCNNYTNNYNISYIPPHQEYRIGVPKNILAKSNRNLNLGLDTYAPEDRITQYEVPFFWGVLFPDGYNTSQVSKFVKAQDSLGQILRNRKIYANDPNLKEYSVLATWSLPSFDDEQQLLKMIRWSFTLSSSKCKNPIDLVRKTGGWYRPVEFVNDIINSYGRLNSYITCGFDAGANNLNNYFRSWCDVGPNYQNYSVHGLEPINPRRLQFSPMSIDFLYGDSQITNSKFSFIQSTKTYYSSTNLPNPGISEGTTSLLDYAKFLWSGNDVQATKPETYIPFLGNTYNYAALSYGNSYGDPIYGTAEGISNNTLQRHPSPLGSVNGGLILPPFPESNGTVRSPVMPVITIKSKVKTTATALEFSAIQYFGNPQKTTVAGGQVGQVTVLPIGGGLAWQDPNTPISVNSTPQWGDRNRTDDIDSFGTMALHVRIFEGWPEAQTIYLGPMFTPLHFNPSCENGTQYNSKGVYTYDVNSKDITCTELLNDEGKPIPAISSVDFKEPTDKTGIEGNLLSPGTIVTEDNLRSPSDWKINTVRRAKLLSGGGFAYFKNILCVSKAMVKTSDGQPIQRGTGYKEDDEFLLPDGSTFKVSVNDGKIQSIKSFTPNHGPVGNITLLIKDPTKYNEFTSLGIQPEYLGEDGEGAAFDLEFKVAAVIKHDPAPKEVSPITRLSSSSNEGKGVVEETKTTIVELSNTTKKDFDIFYFFHNDPTAYGYNLTFNNKNAHYIIYEVNPV